MARTVAAGTITEHEKVVYLAGIIDGEGHLRIIRHPEGHHNIEVIVTGTDTRLIDWLLENFEGSFSCTLRNDHPHHKAMLQWKLSGKLAAKLAERIYPYLVLKKEQAQLILEYWERHEMHKVTSGNSSAFFQLEAAKLKDRMHALNRKGK